MSFSRRMKGSIVEKFVTYTFRLQLYTNKTYGLRISIDVSSIPNSVTHFCNDLNSPRVKNDILSIIGTSAGT